MKRIRPWLRIFLPYASVLVCIDLAIRDAPMAHTRWMWATWAFIQTLDMLYLWFVRRQIAELTKERDELQRRKDALMDIAKQAVDAAIRGVPF